MAQGDRECRINEKKNKERYLEYFPPGMTGESMQTENEEANRETCVYCGSVHVRQYTQEAFQICEDCYAQLLGSRQEFTEVLQQTRKGLKQLMGISVDRDMSFVYKSNWLQQYNRYFGKSKDRGSGFGQEFVKVQKAEKTIKFIVYERMPRQVFSYLTAGYIVGIFLDKKIHRLSGIMAYRPMKYAMMKWCALHYMYLNGYCNFCQWKEKAELEDVEYKELAEEMGFPSESGRIDMSEIIDILNDKIDLIEGKEDQEESEKECGEIDTDTGKHDKVDRKSGA